MAKVVMSRVVRRYLVQNIRAAWREHRIELADACDGDKDKFAIAEILALRKLAIKFHEIEAENMITTITRKINSDKSARCIDPSVCKSVYEKFQSS